jgi:hypothetical protein
MHAHSRCPLALIAKILTVAVCVPAAGFAAEDESDPRITFEADYAAGRLQSALINAHKLRDRLADEYGDDSWAPNGLRPVIIELEKAVSLPEDQQFEYRSALFLRTSAFKTRNPNEDTLKTLERAKEKIAATVSKKTYTFVLLLQAQSGYASVMRDYASSETYARECLELGRDVFGENSPYLVHPMNNLAFALIHLNRLAEAESLLKSSIRLASKYHGKESPEYVKTVKNLAKVYLGRGEHELAAAFAGYGIALAEKANPGLQIEDPGALWTYAQATANMESFEEALTAIKVCERIWLLSLRENDPLLTEVKFLRIHVENAIKAQESRRQQKRGDSTSKE